jgi:hypothetical protein
MRNDRSELDNRSDDRTLKSVVDDLTKRLRHGETTTAHPLPAAERKRA